LGVFERQDTPREPNESGTETAQRYDILIFGLGRLGTAVGLRLQKRGISVLGIDFNPVAVRRWRELGLDAKYGDASDPEFIAELPLAGAGWVVSTVPVHPTGLTHSDTRNTLIQLARSTGFRGAIAVTSHSQDDTEELLSSGADIVLEPFQDAADRAVDLL